ncbi:MAG: hypothetical protein HY855_18080 [Burkholderiales bacterium]|nr:hypothetical protein [Burkholderiales bacterium]
MLMSPRLSGLAVRLGPWAIALAVLHGCGGTEAPPPCDRACLLTQAEQLARAQAAPDSAARITDNGAVVAWTAATPQRLRNVVIHARAADAERQSAIVYGTGDDGGRPAVFSLRSARRDGRVVEVELMVAHSGEASLFPAAVPLAEVTLLQEVLPEALRSKPEVMMAAAQAYFDGIERHNGAAVPVTDDCRRVENGVETTHRPPNNLKCNSLDIFGYIPKVRDRRYPLFDVERGLVLGVVVFDIPGGTFNGRLYEPRSMLLSEVFRVEGGKIRRIEATMRNIPLGGPTGWN